MPVSKKKATLVYKLLRMLFKEREEQSKMKDAISYLTWNEIKQITDLFDKLSGVEWISQEKKLTCTKKDLKT